MKLPSHTPEARVRYALALIAGLMLAAAFPKLNIAGFAWAAPGLLLFTALGQDARAAFRLGFIGGLSFNLAALYWLLHMPVAVAPIFAWLALSAYCALYPALWLWLCWKLLAPPLTLEQFTETPWLRRFIWTLACAALWTTLEFILCRFLTGFPWLPLGVTQHQMLPLIQIASLTGVHGVSFLVVWFSVALCCTLLALARWPAQRWRWMRELIAPALAVVLVLWFGFARLAEPVPSRGELKVALVQPSIPQVMIWDPKEKAARFAKLMELSENALATKPDLLVWPEAALPALDDTMTQSIFEMVRKHRVWLLLGADDAEPRAGSDDPKNAKFYNSAFLLSPDGQVAGRYRKQRLVIFGEYVPLVKWLPFLKYLTPVGDGFTPGDHAVQFDLKEPRVRFAPLICFEDVFAAAGREATEPDTDFLVNVTNDGWFGESAEQWQHAANSVFRAVENGLPLVRCANNGVSCWVDARGVMRATHFEGSDNVYQAGFKTVKVPLPLNTARQTTFYNRYGDWFGWACVVVSALLTVLNWRRSRTH